MSASLDPAFAPIGDVGTALLLVDSRLAQLAKADATPDPERCELVERTLESFGPKAAQDVLDGACTLMYLYVDWLRKSLEAHGQDPMEYIVPYVASGLRAMRKSVKPEAIPTMVGMLTACVLGLSPTLWRRRYGGWLEAEMNALEASLVLLADRINNLTEDPNAASRMIVDLLNVIDEELDDRR